VPIDYKELYLLRATPWALCVPEEARRVFETFDVTLDMFRSHEVLSYALKYAESGVSIHIHKAISEGLKRHMTSLEAFEEELIYRSEQQDRFDNMDI
jgi:tRNA G37 N-methylase Trm5